MNGNSGKSGPFMSLILHRLDLNNLPRITSEVSHSEGETDDDDIQGVTDREDEGDEEFLTVTDCEEDIEEDDKVSDREDDDIEENGKVTDCEAGDIEENDESPEVVTVEDEGGNEEEFKVVFRRSWKESEEDEVEEENEQVDEELLTSDQQISVAESAEPVSDQASGVRRSWRNRNKKINYDYKALLGSESESEELGASERISNKDNNVEVSNADDNQSGQQQRLKFDDETENIVKKREYCSVCKRKGELLYCDGCPRAFHLSCLDPPLTARPDSWKCFACNMEPLDKVDRIFTWRNQGLRREFFVHFAGKSYWTCKWVPDVQLEVFQPSLIRCYYKKFGKLFPPNLDEGDARRLRKNNQDPLEIRFYQNGVRPEWLRINRIIDHQTECDGNFSYLIKWQQLGYESATWEDVNSCGEIADDFAVAIRVYHEWLDYFWGDPCLPTIEEPFVHKHVVIPPEQPISNLKIKLQTQPEYLPSGMVLHDYQLEGLNWLRYSWANRINTILGDEMGLGKTIQTIVFLNTLVKEGHCQGPFLISAPLSTLLNWEREFEAWAPGLYVVTYTGDQNTRLLIRKTEFVEDSSHINKLSKKIRSPVKFHVLLTSYQFPTMDATCLGSIPWEMIIVDEGHRLKDDRTLLFKDLMNYTTSYKLLLTGTPLQNNLQELFNLLNFLCPEKFQDASAFLTEFEDIAKEDQIKKLHTLLGPHLLRRMKVDVLKDMPSKSELIVRVELSPMQKEYSKHILMKNFQALNAKGGRQTSLLNVFMDLRKICNHPYLFSKASAEAPKVPVTGLYELEAMTEASGKLVMLRKMLERLKQQGHRVLIFSQMTSMLDILEEFLFALGHSYERLDGSVLGARRQDSIDRFNAEGAEQFVFLLSTKAGGLGINLATADTVIIYDSDWNPHNDIQAFSRAHRIGQKNKVMIYRFVTRRSVEERIVQVCKKKMMLTHLVVRPEVGKTIFNKDELEDIIRFGTEELFSDQDANAPIYYTDAMIEGILDRTQEEVNEKTDCNNDFFQGFKVANCEVEDEVILLPSRDEAKDPDQWKYLLRQEIKKKEDKAHDLTNYGKGMRKRHSLKYGENEETEQPYPKRSKPEVSRRERQTGKPRTYGRSGRNSQSQYVGETLERHSSMNYLFVPNNIQQVLKGVDVTKKSNVNSNTKAMRRGLQQPKATAKRQKKPYMFDMMTSYPNVYGDRINSHKLVKNVQELPKKERKRWSNTKGNLGMSSGATSHIRFEKEVSKIYESINVPDGIAKRRPGRPKKSQADLKNNNQTFSRWNPQDISTKIQKLPSDNANRKMQRKDLLPASHMNTYMVSNVDSFVKTMPVRGTVDGSITKFRGRSKKQCTEGFSYENDDCDDIVEVQPMWNRKRQSNFTEATARDRQVFGNRFTERIEMKTQKLWSGVAETITIGTEEKQNNMCVEAEVKTQEIQNNTAETSKLGDQPCGNNVTKSETQPKENTRPEIIKIVSQPREGTGAKFLLSSAKIAPQLALNNFAS